MGYDGAQEDIIKRFYISIQTNSEVQRCDMDQLNVSGHCLAGCSHMTHFLTECPLYDVLRNQSIESLTIGLETILHYVQFYIYFLT